jgi:GDP-L-fucose synthase
MMIPLAGARIFVAGYRGMVGSALVRRLASENCEILAAGREVLDLLDQQAVQRWMESNRPDVVFLAAAKVGGIYANSTKKADFLYQNAMISANVIHAAHRAGVQNLLNLGSSCIYPKFAEQPIREEALLTGALEPTNDAYAIAKIMALKLAQAYQEQYGRNFISAMPTNLYGKGDSYDPNNSHVLPALIRKAHQAKIKGDSAIAIWGTGTPKREFLHADDCADACIFLMQNYSGSDHINVGSGSDIPIADLALLVCDVVGFKGSLTFDTSKPDGTPRKLMSSDRLTALGWQPRIGLRDGIADAYADFLKNHASGS